MSEDYYELARINFNKVILHGRRIGGSEVEQELTLQEREEVGRLQAKHDDEMHKLLRRIAGEMKVVAA